MSKEFTREEMIDKLTGFFQSSGYDCKTYSDKLGVRVPIYAKKDEVEVVVDLFTSKEISKKDYFRHLHTSGVQILDASSLKFFQYYFPAAQVYLAYPFYSESSGGFKKLKMACIKNGIGLLKVPDSGYAQEDDEAKSISLADSLCQKAEEEFKAKKVREFIEELTESYVHNLVYYPDPSYQRREIVERPPNLVSFILVDELQNLKKINQKAHLKKFSRGYRDQTKEDYEIALKVITYLWKKNLRVEYPKFQKEFEPVLLLNRYYRDHFLHEFQVYLLGAIIIDSLYDEVAGDFRKKYSAEIEDAWLAAAAYHDFNYNIERYETWTKDFFKKTLNFKEPDESNPAQLNLEKSFIRENFLFTTKRICNDLDCSIDSVTIRFFYERAVTERNHALLSALSLIKLLHRNSSLDQKAISHAASTIVCHDEDNWKYFCGYKKSRKEYEKKFASKIICKEMEFKKNPLPFLLIFSDVVQEWGRVGRGYEETQPVLEALTINNSEIIVELSMRDDESLKIKRNELNRVKKLLKDPRFAIKLISRETGKKATVKMTG